MTSHLTAFTSRLIVANSTLQDEAPEPSTLLLFEVWVTTGVREERVWLSCTVRRNIAHILQGPQLETGGIDVSYRLLQLV